MKVVCFGDSLTSCGGEGGRFSDILQDRFPEHELVNRGVGGESFVEGLARLEQDVLAERPDVVLVEYGANDWWRAERPPQAWAADLEHVLARVKACGARAVVLGVFGQYLDGQGRRTEKAYGSDERAVQYRRLEAEAAQRHACPYVANIQERIVGRRCCWRDRNHPNEYGNRSVADAVEPVLAELLDTSPLPVRKPELRTTLDMWREAVALAPDKPAVVYGDTRLTYGEAAARVDRLAAGLRRAAGRPNPKIAVFLPNCLDYYLIYWATVRLGGVIVPLNTWLKEDSLAGIFANVAPDVLVVRSAQDRAVLEAAAAAGTAAVFATEPEPGSGPAPLSRAFCDEAPPDGEAPLPESLSIVMHTSGTTATPKGAMMRHCDLMFNVTAAINAHQFCRSDVHLLVNPMFHCTALYSSLPTAAYTKTPVIITTPTSPARLMALVAEERVTTFLSVPTVFQQILKLRDLDAYDASSLRVIAYAGSTMPVSTIRKLAARFPEVSLHNFFGLTETISMTHVLTGEQAEERPDSIGRLLPFVDAMVIDEEGARRGPGELGELLFARENVIPGYYNDPERLAEALTVIDGRPWFRTGDLAVVDEEGYFFIKGRKKDMIIVGGENVFAAEVEAVLMTHNGVEEAAVVGAPAAGAYAHLGEEVHAYVVRANAGLDETELRRYCFERLPSFKVPRRVTFLERLPRNPSGKVVKTELGACGGG